MKMRVEIETRHKAKEVKVLMKAQPFVDLPPPSTVKDFRAEKALHTHTTKVIANFHHFEDVEPRKQPRPVAPKKEQSSTSHSQLSHINSRNPGIADVVMSLKPI
jgi:hypothetical protein